MSDSPGVIGQGGLAARTLPDEAEARRRISIAETAGLEVFASSELERVEGSNGLLAFTGSGPDRGSLWVQGSRYHVDVLGRDTVRLCFEGDPPTPRFLIPANAENAGAPTTLAEWEATQAVRAEAIEEQRKAAAAKRDRLRAAAQPFTYDDAAHDGERLTLRQAAEAVDLAGGTIRVVDGRLVVGLPPSARLTLGLPSRASKGGHTSLPGRGGRDRGGPQAGRRRGREQAPGETGPPVRAAGAVSYRPRRDRTLDDRLVALGFRVGGRHPAPCQVGFHPRAGCTCRGTPRSRTGGSEAPLPPGGYSGGY